MSDPANQSSQTPSADSTLPAPPQNRYPVLKLISTAFRILAFLVGALTVVNIIITVSAIEIADLWLFFDVLNTLVTGAVTFVALYAVAEIIRLLIDLEYNSRGTTSLVRTLIERNSTRDDQA